MPEPVDVVYIASAPRSGSTVLSSMLGEVPGFFNAGEVRHLWRQLARSGRCGCGRALKDCDTWRSIVTDAEAQATDSTVNLAHAGEAHALIRTLPFAWMRRMLFGRRSRSLDPVTVMTLPVYAKLASTHPASLIVDSSKSPSYCYLLAGCPDVNVHVLHLVRDSRAVVYSVLRDHGRRMPGPLRLRAVAYHAAKWVAWNLLTETWVRRRAGSYSRVVYEDLAAEPYARMRQLLSAFGDAAAPLPLASPDAHVAHLTVNHTLFGNGNRFRVGLVPIHRDDEWRTAMRWHERALVTAITWPLLLRYGFHRLQTASNSGGPP